MLAQPGRVSPPGELCVLRVLSSPTQTYSEVVAVGLNSLSLDSVTSVLVSRKQNS